MRQFADEPSDRFNVFLAHALHDVLDLLFGVTALAQQVRIDRIGFVLPPAVQAVADLVREEFEQRPDLLGDATVAVQVTKGGQNGHVDYRQYVVVERVFDGWRGVFAAVDAVRL